MPKWIIDHSTEIGTIVMAILAGTAAYIKAFESAEKEWPASKHIITFSMRQFYAVFGALLTWYAIQWVISYGVKVPDPAIPLLIGVAAYNGVRVVDIFTTTLVEKGRKMLGLEPKS